MAGRQFDALPEGWESTHDDLGQIYYFNRVTRAVQWARPDAYAMDGSSFPEDTVVALIRIEN